MSRGEALENAKCRTVISRGYYCPGNFPAAQQVEYAQSGTVYFDGAAIHSGLSGAGPDLPKALSAASILNPATRNRSRRNFLCRDVL